MAGLGEPRANNAHASFLPSVVLVDRKIINSIHKKFLLDVTLGTVTLCLLVSLISHVPMYVQFQLKTRGVSLSW